MKEYNRAHNTVKLNLPDHISVQDVPLERTSSPTAKRRGGSQNINTELEDMLDALKQENARVVDRFILDADPEAAKHDIRRTAEKSTLAVNLEPDEASVLLLVKEDTYEWRFAETQSPEKRRRAGRPENVALFRLDQVPPRAKGDGKRQRGVTSKFLWGQVRVIVLKFVAARAVEAIAERLERAIEPGLIHICSHDDAQKWERISSLSKLAVPEDSTARILLFIHGTFSSTVGSFGALTGQELGRTFLECAIGKYHAVIGYDHYTLSESPADNAEAIYKALSELKSPSISIDVIAFSRGGLVFRYLKEVIVPREQADISFSQAIFVACTNAGTQLAEPDNWVDLTNFYINLISGASRLLGMATGAVLPDMLLREGTQLIGGLVKYMAQDAVTKKSLPGLAAMEPDGDFIKELNRSSRASGGSSQYYTISSDFEPTLADHTGGLGDYFLTKLADGLVDQLMGESNDLVVHTKSMQQVGTSKIEDSFGFGENGKVFHTVYFQQKEVATMLGRWLNFFQKPQQQQQQQQQRQERDDGSQQKKRKIKRDDGGQQQQQQQQQQFDYDEYKRLLQHIERDQQSLNKGRGLGHGESFDPQETPSYYEVLAEGATAAAPSAAPEGEDADAEENTADPKSPTALCHIHASMDEEAQIEAITTLEVTLSKETIVRDIRESSQGGAFAPDWQKPLTIQVFARNHCVVNGSSRVEVDLNALNEDLSLYFDIIPKHTGQGLIEIIARQSNHPLVRLFLKPKFVAQIGTAPVDRTQSSADVSTPDDRPELPNVLYIREGKMGDAQTLTFQIDFRTINRKFERSAEPFKSDDARLKYITDLYRKLEDFWANDAEKYDNFMADLKGIGADMFTQLFPKDLQDLLWQERDHLENIQVFSDEPYIPWELVYLKEPNRTITDDSRFLADLGLVRWPFNREEYPSTKLYWRGDKAVYIIPDYPRQSNAQLPATQTERVMLEQLLNAKPIKPSSKDVIETLKQTNSFDVIHFACHGFSEQNSIWDSSLMMQGEVKRGSYEEDLLSSSRVNHFVKLSDNNNKGPLVFLNACQVGRQGYLLTASTGFATAFIAAGAGAFVSTHWSVGDGSALTYSKTFYQEMLNGQTIIDAMATAREAAKNNKEVTWLAYVAYADPYLRFVK